MEGPRSPVHPKPAAPASPPGNNVLVSPAHRTSCGVSWRGWLRWQEGGPWRLSPGSWHPHPEAITPSLACSALQALRQMPPSRGKCSRVQLYVSLQETASVPLPPQLITAEDSRDTMLSAGSTAGMPVCGRPDVSALYVKCTPTETTSI